MFSEILVKNRDLLKESESFVLTLQKDKNSANGEKKRVNVRKILSIDQVTNEPYSEVTIELKENCKINEVKEILCKNGNTTVNLILNFKNRKANYLLQNKRKFDLKDLKP